MNKAIFFPLKIHMVNFSEAALLTLFKTKLYVIWSSKGELNSKHKKMKQQVKHDKL